MRVTATNIKLFLSNGLSFSQQYHSYSAIYSYFGKYQGSIRVLLQRLFNTGEVEKILRNGEVSFRLTTYGSKKLKSKLALDTPLRTWDKKWRIIIARKNEDKLVKFGFAIVKKTIYISPFPVEKMHQDLGFIIETKNVFPFENRVLARYFWDLNRLEKRYKSWIEQTKLKEKANIDELIFQYTLLVQDDPKLPRELLATNWHFENARNIFVVMIKRHFGSQKR